MSATKKRAAPKKRTKKKSEPEIRIVNLALEGMLLPPREGLCQECAVDHEPTQPHNQQSLFWQYAFYRKSGGSWPTWKDAMAHCPADVQKFWRVELGKRGVEVPQ